MKGWLRWWQARVPWRGRSRPRCQRLRVGRVGVDACSIGASSSDDMVSRRVEPLRVVAISTAVEALATISGGAAV